MTIARLLALTTCLLLSTAGPGHAAQPEDDAEPRESPYLTLRQPRAWTVSATVRLASVDDFEEGLDDYRRRVTGRDFAGASFWVPYVERTASAIAPKNMVPTGDLLKENTEVDGSPDIEQDGALNPYARWNAPPGGRVRNVRLVSQWEIVSHETQFNDRLADGLAWPAGPWPAEVEQVLQTPLFLPAGDDLDAVHAGIDELVSRWTGGEDPKQAKPLTLAKFLAGKLQEHTRSVTEGVVSKRVRAGNRVAVRAEDASRSFTLPMDGLGTLLETGAGSSHDLALLLAHVYRRVGIPARVVVGVTAETGGRFGEEKGGEIRTWVEWALYDEERALTTWVPVDIAAIRARGSRMKSLGRPWDFFGSHRELDTIAPIALHLESPLAPALRPPGLVGVRVEGSAGRDAWLEVQFRLTRTPTGGAGRSRP